MMNDSRLHKGHGVPQYYFELPLLKLISPKNILEEIQKVINLTNPEPREHILFVMLEDEIDTHVKLSCCRLKYDV